MDSKKIAPFDKWTMDQKTKKLNEANVNIECEWWDECIVQVLKQLESQTEGYLTCNSLEAFIKFKNSVLGKDANFVDNNSIIEFIKELIFFNYAKNLYVDSANGGDNTIMHSQGVVIEQLADTILDKILNKSDYYEAPQATSNVMLNDNPTDFEEMPFEKNVLTFGKYLKMLNEAKTKLEFLNYDECLERILDTIAQDASQNDIHSAVLQYIKKNGKIQNKGIEDPAEVGIMIKNCLGLWADMITKEIMDALNLKKGKGMSNEEVK